MHSHAPRRMQCSCVRAGGRGWLLCPFSILSRPGGTSAESSDCLSRLVPVLDCVLLLLAGNRLGRTLAGASVGVCALAAHRQALAVTQAAIAAQVHQSLDVHGNLAPEIALHQVFVLGSVDDFANPEHFLVSEL